MSFFKTFWTDVTDSTIKIDIKTYNLDSTVTIEVNETKLLVVTDHGVEGRKGPFYEDVDFDLDYFVVTKNDSLISNIDYLENSSWNYNDGLYSTRITNDEFN